MYRFIRKVIGLIKALFLKAIYLSKIEGIFSSIGRGGEVLIIGENANMNIGKNVVIRNNVCLRITNGKLVLGDNVFLNDNLCLVSRKKIIIGKNTLIGQNLCIYDNDHKYTDKSLIKEQGFETKEVIIGENVWIGSGSILLSGTIIGDNSIIAAGSIVKGIIPENCIYKNQIVKKIEQIY